MHQNISPLRNIHGPYKAEFKPSIFNIKKNNKKDLTFSSGDNIEECKDVKAFHLFNSMLQCSTYPDNL